MASASWLFLSSRKLIRSKFSREAAGASGSVISSAPATSTTRVDDLAIVQGAPLYKKSRVESSPMRRPAVRDATRTARAFAPGHVTGFFDPSLDAPDPRGRGSTGGGLVLGAGATAEATWTPGGPSRVTVRSPAARRLPISEEEPSGRRAANGHPERS